MRTKRATIWGVGLAALVAVSINQHEGEAFVRIPYATDAVLLESDAIVIATVEKVGIARDDGEAVELTLSRARYVGGRWDSSTQARTIMRVRRARHNDTSVRPRVSEPAMREGGRYLLFLRGGRWGDAPLIGVAQSIYEIRENQVLCNGGEIYGVGEFGLLCSTREQQAAPALSEPALSDALGEALRVARLRRPAMASSNDRAHRTFQLARYAGSMRNE